MIDALQTAREMALAMDLVCVDDIGRAIDEALGEKARISPIFEGPER